MENQPESKNPMGESKAGNGSKSSLLIAVGILGLIALAIVTVLVFSQSDDGTESGNGNGIIYSEHEGDDASVMEIRRNLAIEEMLQQYDRVVSATAEDVSWEEYFIELDAFIRDLETLEDIDPNPLLTEGLELFVESRTTYDTAIQIGVPDAPVDQEGIDKAGEIISEAQDKVNSYLDEIEYGL